jgi:hydrogenase 3 maturation protease
MTDLREQLRQCLFGRACFLALGNVDYGDDGLGVRLGEWLLAAGMSDVTIAGTTPERYLGGLARERFEHIVFLDAVEFGGAAGSVVFLDASAIAAKFPQISTHKISLATLSQWAEACGTKAWLLGVEPESLKPGQRLTETVETTLEALSSLLQSLRPQTSMPQTAGSQPIAEVCVG